MGRIFEMEGKIERRMEKKVGNPMKDTKVPLDMWDRRHLRIYTEHGGNINQPNDKRMKVDLPGGIFKTDSGTATIRNSDQRKKL
jgi:hypothetical protein